MNQTGYSNDWKQPEPISSMDWKKLFDGLPPLYGNLVHGANGSRAKMKRGEKEGS
jgi:hypothetical protein